MQVLLQRLQKDKVFSLWIKYELAKHEEERNCSRPFAA